MVMVHSDDNGLVLPPRVALTQVIIIPIEKVGDDENNKKIVVKCNELFKELKNSGIRVDVDDRDNQKAAWKYNHWEQRGVPIRLELGSKDLEKSEVRCVKRNDGKKMQLNWDDLSQHLH
jgi:prolyl-tRNA synthetase